MTDKADSVASCPSDTAAMIAMRNHEYAVHVCSECHGIWLPGKTVEELALDLSEAGATGYVHFSRIDSPDKRCPADQSVLTIFESSPGNAVGRCAVCSGLWLPGEVLARLNDRARRRAGNDEPFPNLDTAGLRIGAATITAGFDPRVVEDFLITTRSLWR